VVNVNHVLLEHSHLMVITNVQLAQQHAINAVELRTYALNAQPIPIYQEPHAYLVPLVYMHLLNQLTQLHASLVRNSTVKPVLHLSPPRPVPPVTINIISPQAPARLV